MPIKFASVTDFGDFIESDELPVVEHDTPDENGWFKDGHQFELVLGKYGVSCNVICPYEGTRPHPDGAGACGDRYCAVAEELGYVGWAEFQEYADPPEGLDRKDEWEFTINGPFFINYRYNGYYSHEGEWDSEFYWRVDARHFPPVESAARETVVEEQT